MPRVPIELPDIREALTVQRPRARKLSRVQRLEITRTHVLTKWRDATDDELRADPLYDPCQDLIARLLRAGVDTDGTWEDPRWFISMVRHQIGEPPHQTARINFHPGPHWPARPTIKWDTEEAYRTGWINHEEPNDEM